MKKFNFLYYQQYAPNYQTNSLTETMSTVQSINPNFNKPKETDALLGIELFFQLLIIGQQAILGSKVMWQKTKLAWILVGKINVARKARKSTQCMLSLCMLQISMNRFWELEEFPNTTFLSEEFKVEKYFKETNTSDSNTVRLPFNEKMTMLGESHKLVEQEFYSLV
jgi:hypothetical protein